MAIRLMVRNTTTNTTLATRDIPESVLPAIQRAFPNAQAALDWMTDRLRQHVRDVRLGILSATQASGAATEQASEIADFDTNEWP